MTKEQTVQDKILSICGMPLALTYYMRYLKYRPTTGEDAGLWVPAEDKILF